jgi:hypothetical protein
MQIDDRFIQTLDEEAKLYHSQILKEMLKTFGLNE